MEAERDGREHRSFDQCVSLPSLPSLTSTSTNHTPPPRTVNCWPDADSGTVTVNLEYDLKNPSLSLHNVVISIPLPPGAEPSISDPPAHGDYSINPHTGRLEWVIEEVSEQAGTSNGSLEFEVQGDDADELFPVGIEFVSQKGMCGVEVRLLPSSSFPSFERVLILPPPPTSRSSASRTRQATTVSSSRSTRSLRSTGTRSSRYPRRQAGNREEGAMDLSSDC